MGNYEFRYDGWELRKVTDQIKINLFSCEDSGMNRYFHRESAVYRRLLMVQSYHFCPIDYCDPKPVMLLDLCNDNIQRDQISGEAFKSGETIDDSGTLPAVKIARLGRDKEFSGLRITPILMNALKAFFVWNNRTGCRIFTLDAYTPLVPLYRKCGFEPTLDAENEGGKGPVVSMFFDLYPFYLNTLRSAS